MNYKQLFRKYRKGIALAGLAALFIFTAFLGLRGISAKRGTAVSGAQAPTLTKPLIDPRINQLQGELKNNNLSDEARESVLEKIKIAERMAAEQAAGASAEGKDKEAPSVPQSPSLIGNPLAVPDRIFEGSQGMIRPETAQILNCWQGARGGKILQVFAGALPDHPEQGLLIIFTEDPEQAQRTMQTVESPGKDGPIRILEVKESLMTLQAGEGRQVHFNLETLQFQD